jgi:YaiO family outer membrane protein
MKEKSRNSKFPYFFTPCILLFFLLSVVNIYAQPNAKNDPDGIFMKARELAFEGKYEQARTLLDQVLENYPNYHDVKILKARTFAWEGNYIRADELLQQVLQADAANRDALLAMIDVKIWSGDYKEAIAMLDKALASEPNNTHLLYRKALAMTEIGDDLAAAVLLNQVLSLDPTYAEAKDLLKTIESNRLLNFISINYRGFHFLQSNLDTRPWHLFFAEYGRRTRLMGPVIVRANYALRSDIDVNSLQIEVDAYPTIRPGTYLYLNAGYSADSRLFPMTRFGFEVFQALPAAMEFSGGFRILNFDENENYFSTKDLLIITGSLSKYYRQYYFSLRPYFTFSSEGDDPNSRSLFFTARRYFSSSDHYLSLTLGRGFSADFDRLSGGQVYDVGGTAIEAMLMYQQPLSSHFVFRAGAGYKIYKQEVLYGNPYVFEGSLIYRF